MANQEEAHQQAGSFGYLDEEELVHRIDVRLVLRKHKHRRRGLLQALEQISQLGLLFDVLDFLNHVHVCCTRSPDIHLT